MPENNLEPCPYRNRCAFVDETCSEDKSLTCDVLANTAPKRPKEWNPQEPVPVTLTREQWQDVSGFMKYCADWCHAKMLWWRDFCADKKMGAEKAAKYEADVQKYETLSKVIEEATYAERESQ